MEYSKIYLSFLNYLKSIIPEYESIINTLLNESNEKQFNRGVKLVSSLNTTTLFNNFIKNKIKVFSHKEKDTLKISESLFGKELTLKKLFNNRDEDMKKTIWVFLHKLVLIIKEFNLINDANNKILKDEIDKLTEVIGKLEVNTSISNTKECINKIFNTSNLNDTTNDMINDILQSFESAFTNNNGNPFQSIMGINQIITDKYKDKIDNGDIDLTQIMSSLEKNIPGLNNISGITDIFKSLSGNEENKETVIMDENFSTANVEIGKVNDETSNFTIGNVLKTMDQVGISPLGGGITTKNNNIMDIFNSLKQNNTEDNINNNDTTNKLDLEKLFGVFNKLTTSDGNINDLQNIIQNDLGIDINEIGANLKNIVEKND
jgi:hypothetical protein